MWRLIVRVLLLVATYVHASGVEPECVNGVWTHQTPDQLPHIDCSRSPPAVRWSALTQERCRAWRDDSDWPTQDMTITRRASWRSARALAMTKLRNKRVWFVGDSISSLFVHGIVCELNRYGLEYVMDTDLQRDIDDVDPEAWVSGPPFRVSKFTLPNMTIVGKGWNRYFQSEWDAMLPLGDVFIFNYALHYPENEKELFINDYTLLLNKCNTAYPSKQCIFREVSAQLFANGAYDPQNPQNKGNGTCVSNQDALWSPTNWVYQQNSIIRDMIGREYTNVKILPFYNMSAVRGDQTELHFCAREAERSNPGKKSDCKDCSHLTMTPVLWAKVVDEIYKLL